MRFICRIRGYEFWARYDEDSSGWDVFLDEEGETFIGRALSLSQCQFVARNWTDNHT
jgi:hypothetical protein